MSTDRSRALSDLDQLPMPDRIARLAALGQDLLGRADGALPDTERTAVIDALTTLLKERVGTSQERLGLGMALGLLGDPRLRAPGDASYWSRVHLDDGPVELGRFMVTNQEFSTFVDAGGYDDDAHWTDAGRAWREGAERRWPDLAASDEARPFVVPNQPVVGVTWFEAAAYAAWAGARLPEFEERLWATRGREKRPYPWGSPFGEGNANTQEEVLGQPCAVGLYHRDRTPEGIFDLAGNVAEWCADGVADERWVHPGAWDQPSMAAWAKARVLEAPGTWSSGLGFRLARDVQGD